MGVITCIATFAALACAVGQVSSELRYGLGAPATAGIWTVSNKNGSLVGIPASVPGGIYSDLRGAGILPEEIYYRFNDHAYRWVGDDSWTFTRKFSVPADLIGKTQYNLVFDGIDSIGQVKINNDVPVNVDNMFVRYVIPFKPQATNTLTVTLNSAVAFAASRSEQTYVAPACVAPEFQGECHANQVRKMQASFSWDWGPAFPSAGIWKSVYLEAFDTLMIRDTVYDIQYSEASEEWTVAVRVHAESLTEGSYTGDGDLELEIEFDNVVRSIRTGYSFQGLNGEAILNTEIKVSAIDTSLELWWPNGLGRSQKLYKATVRIIPNGSDDISVKSSTIAFKTLRVVQDFVQPGDPSKGRHFYFEVNGEAIFMKGSNWIPAHVLPEVGSQRDYAENLLKASAEAGFNMLRVWGGGVYESEHFYQLCDELGILVWQDFLFACSMYPVDAPYLESVRTEIVQTVRRLQHHTSIALWAGNNENEAALIGNWYQTAGNLSAYKEQYIQLYVDTIKPLVNAEDPSRAYLVSSPSNGIKSEEDGYISNDPYSALYGDIHYYNYLADGWNPAVYPRTRFASEFGFQSFPSMRSLRAVTQTGDLALGLDSELATQRQHHPAGNTELKMQVESRLLPGGQYNWGVESMFEKFTYLTQIYQAMATKTEAECHRRWRGMYDAATGEGYTMGSLYWQLNDIWQGPTWAGIEHDGTWKMMHYYAAKIYNSYLVSPYITPSNRLSVHAANDYLEDFGPARVKVTVHSWSQFASLHSFDTDFDLLKNSAVEVFEQSLSNILETAGCGNMVSHVGSRLPEDSCFLVVQLMSRDESQLLSENFVLPVAFNNVIGIAQKPQLEVTSVTSSSVSALSRYAAVFDVQVSTDNVAPFVWLEAGGLKGRFSDNGFLLYSATKTVQFYALEDMTAAELESKLTVTSLTHNWL